MMKRMKTMAQRSKVDCKMGFCHGRESFAGSLSRCPKLEQRSKYTSNLPLLVIHRPSSDRLLVSTVISDMLDAYILFAQKLGEAAVGQMGKVAEVLAVMQRLCKEAAVRFGTL